MLRVFIVLAIFLAPIQVFAENNEYSRSDFWLKQCNADDRSVCVFYVMGMVNAFVNSNIYAEHYSEKLKEPAFLILAEQIYDRQVGCAIDDSKISFGQRIKIWMKYLTEHPEKHHVLPVFTFGEAMQEAFPCK